MTIMPDTHVELPLGWGLLLLAATTGLHTYLLFKHTMRFVDGGPQ